MEFKDFTDRVDFGDYLEYHNYTGVGVEVGVHSAIFTKKLLSRWTKGEIIGVDCWELQESGYTDLANASQDTQDLRYLQALEAIKPFSDRCSLLRKFSVDASKDFEDDSLDFVFIDANHSYSGCLEDIKAWEPKVKKDGGIICGHDFVDAPNHRQGNFEVIKACRDYFGEEFKNIVEVPDGLWGAWPSWFYKKGEK